MLKSHNLDHFSDDLIPLLSLITCWLRALAVYLNAQPNPALLEALVTSVTSEDAPFGQYWGLLAIGRAIGGQTVSNIPAKILMDLHSFAAERVPCGSDRDYELRKILN
jgi:hypothetical protein